MPKPSGANQDNLTPSYDVPAAGRAHVRRADAADAQRLAEINVLSWQHAYAGIVPDAYLEALDAQTLRDRWLARIEDPGDRVTLCAELDGQVAAYAVVGDYRVQQDAASEDVTGWGELYAIYTDPDLQRRGAGQAVARRRARRAGGPRVATPSRCGFCATTSAPDGGTATAAGVRTAHPASGWARESRWSRSG